MEEEVGEVRGGRVDKVGVTGVLYPIGLLTQDTAHAH